MLCLGGCANGVEGESDGFRLGETTLDTGPADSEGDDGSGSASPGTAEPGANEEPEPDADEEPWGMPPEGGDAGWAEMVVPDKVACDTWVWQDVNRSGHSVAGTVGFASTNALNAAKAAYKTRAKAFAKAVPCVGCLNRITKSRIPAQSKVSPADEKGCREAKSNPPNPDLKLTWCGKEYKGTEFVMCSKHRTTETELPETTQPSPEESWEYVETDDPVPTPAAKICSQTSKVISGHGFGVQFSESESISEATHAATNDVWGKAHDWVATQCQKAGCRNQLPWLTGIDLPSPNEAACTVVVDQTESLTSYLCDNDAQVTQHVMCTE